MKREGTLAAPFYLTLHGLEEELDAIFVITVETYPAEPYSYGRSRGDETEVSARLLCWERHGETYDRAAACDIAGEAEIIRQEELTADAVEPDSWDGGDFGDWLFQKNGGRAADRMAAE